MDEIKCKTCSKDFPGKWTGRNRNKIFCSKSCCDKDWVNRKGKEHRRKWRSKKREFVSRIKITKGCLVCGYNRCARALCFHHVSNKKYSFAHLDVLDKTVIIQEIKKCVVLCHNCHMELHEGLIVLPATKFIIKKDKKLKEA